MLVMNATPNTEGITLTTRVNNDSTSGIYSYVYASGDVTTTTPNSAASTSTRILSTPSGMSSTQPNLINMHFLDYSTTDKHKSILIRSDASSIGSVMLANRWASTNAITTIALLFLGGSTFAAGTTFALYGIVA